MANKHPKLENLKTKGRYRDKKAASEAGIKSGESIRAAKTLEEKYRIAGNIIAPTEMVTKLKNHIPDLPEGITLEEMSVIRASLDSANGDDKARKEINDRRFGQAKQQVEVSGRTSIELKILEVKK